MARRGAAETRVAPGPVEVVEGTEKTGAVAKVESTKLSLVWRCRCESVQVTGTVGLSAKILMEECWEA